MPFWVLFTNPLFWPMTPSFWQCEGQIKPWGPSSLIVAVDTLAGKYGCYPSQRFNVSGHHGVGSSSIVRKSSGGEKTWQRWRKKPLLITRKEEVQRRRVRQETGKHAVSENHLSGDVSHSERCIVNYLFIHPFRSVGINFTDCSTSKGLREQMSTGFMDLFKSLCDNCTSSSSVLTAL